MPKLKKIFQIKKAAVKKIRLKGLFGKAAFLKKKEGAAGAGGPSAAARPAGALARLRPFLFRPGPRSKAVFQRAASFVQRRRAFILSLTAALIISDLLLIESYRLLLPETKPPPPPRPHPSYFQKQGKNFYRSIWEKNIFHTGPLPGALTEREEEPASLEPVKSRLPFELKGLIVHASPARSVASIHDKKGASSSYSEGDLIKRKGEELARITRIERDRVFFLNLKSGGRLEYIALPEQKSPPIAYAALSQKKKSSETALVKRDGSRMTVNRSDVNDYMKRLSEIIREARVVPHRVDGQVEGYRFSYIKPKSVFNDLGFQKNDVLKEVDGEAVTSPQQGFDLFERLRGSSGFKVLVERGGKNIEYEYSVNEDSAMELL